MATKLTDVVTTTTSGAKAPASLTKFPEFGATASVALSAGSAVVQLRAWNITGFKEVLGTFTLPVPAGSPKATDMFDSLPVFSTWDQFDWNVTAISGGGTLTMKLVGLGI